MDKKRMWINMALIAAVLILWLQVILPYLRNKYHWTDETPNSQTNTQTAGTTSAPTTGATTNPATTAPVVRGGPVTTQPIIVGSTEYEPDGSHPKTPYSVGL